MECSENSHVETLNKECIKFCHAFLEQFKKTTITEREQEVSLKSNIVQSLKLPIFK